VLINLSELVTRELEHEIAVTKQQQQQQQQRPTPVADASLVARQQLVERYQLLLRSIDCVTR
jgi:hypothetical protein